MTTLLESLLSDSFNEWSILRVAGMATVFHKGSLRMCAQRFHEARWKEPADAGFLRASFIPWAREQYTVMITEKGEAAIMSNLALAASATAHYHLYDTSAFLIGGMTSNDLPEFLSHEVVIIREAATTRLEKLANSFCEEK